MFKRPLIPIWMGIISICSMFLLGQDAWQNRIEGAWSGLAIDDLTGQPHGVVGVTMTINLQENSLVGTVIGEPIENGLYYPSERRITGTALIPDHSTYMDFECTLSLDETDLDCSYTTRTGEAGTVQMNKVNDVPENPDSSTPMFNYDGSYPHEEEQCVPSRPTFILAWSKPMAPQWDMNAYYTGWAFQLLQYVPPANAFYIELKEGLELPEGEGLTLEVITCEGPGGFRDPFGVIAECPGPSYVFWVRDPPCP